MYASWTRFSFCNSFPFVRAIKKWACVCVRCGVVHRLWIFTECYGLNAFETHVCVYTMRYALYTVLHTHCTLFAMDCQYQFRTTSLHSVNALFIHTPIESGFFSHEVIYFILDENFHVSIQNFGIFSHGVRYVCQSVSCSELIVFRWIELFNRKFDVSLANSIWPNIHIEFVSVVFFTLYPNVMKLGAHCTDSQTHVQLTFIFTYNLYNHQKHLHLHLYLCIYMKYSI